MDDDHVLIRVSSDEASDSWGFVGVVWVGGLEAYRTIRAYATPRDALMATEHMLGNVIGALMAGQEWQAASDEFGHAPLRRELGFGTLPPRARSDDGDDSSHQSAR